MQLEEFARSILLGTTWADKLVPAEGMIDHPRRAALSSPPPFPGRPGHLARIGKANFPGLDQLAADSARGRVLHFFANHELLAMELMALMLLRFPEAPAPFRAGVARTITEEQAHLRLYVRRMQELGVAFGDLPVSDYFWNAMKDMASPLQFVVQMSLTLEQANLDFSLFYQKEVARAGDQETAAILAQVYGEEIGHVKHGLSWFNRWRAESGPGQMGEDDWDAYLRLLPPPMTPRRAKGTIFSAEARVLAGFSERYIRELEVFSGSKGRPPVFWSYNPLCDAEIARGKPGHTPSLAARRLSLDLEHVPMYLARETDVVLTQELPRADWLKSIAEAGFALPEFRRLSVDVAPRESRIGGIEPWGWSPEPFEKFRPWRERVGAQDGSNGAWCRQLLEHADFSQTGFGEFFSKAWSVNYLRDWRTRNAGADGALGNLEDTGRVFSDWETARAQLIQSLGEGVPYVAKAPYGTAGGQNKRVFRVDELSSALGGWIRKIIETQGAIVLEPWLDKQIDLSIQLEIGPDAVRTLGMRRFVNGARMEYRGTDLGAKMSSLPIEVRKFLHSRAAPLEKWRKFAQALGRSLRSAGYEGPAGIDAMVWRDGQSGQLKLKPLVELNPRWTMGRVALELEKRVHPGAPAHWLFLPLRELKERGLPASADEAARVIRAKYPVRRETPGGRLMSGVVFTNDPTTARDVMTLLVIGDDAASDASLKLPPD